MSLAEHYIHKITGIKVFKYQERLTSIEPIFFYAEEIPNGGAITLDRIFRIPIWAVENSEDWFKMVPVKIFVRTHDGVDKYLNNKVYCYNEIERTIKIYRINLRFETKVGVIYFDSLENANIYAARHQPRYSLHDVYSIALEFFIAEKPSTILGHFGAKNSALRLTEEFKKIKQFV